MAVIFLLGPGMWEPTRGVGNPSPIDTRRKIAKIFMAGGHRVILMEDEPDQKGEDMIHKFDRLLRSGATDVVLYWPALARMQTTYDELILLCDRKDFLKASGITIWALHHPTVAKITKDEFKVLEKGNRSRYLTAVARLGIHPLEWDNAQDLATAAQLLSSQLQ